LVVPNNECNVKRTDIELVWRVGLSKDDLDTLLVEDAALDGHCLYSWLSSPTPEDFYVVKVGESSMFRAFPDDAPGQFELPPPVKTVLLPCAVMDNHWTLIVFDVESNMGRMVDPLRIPDDEMIENGELVLKGFRTTYGFNVSTAPPMLIEENYRHQTEGTHNCGVHVALFVQQICAQQEINRLGNMANVRRTMASEIANHVGCFFAEECSGEQKEDDNVLKLKMKKELDVKVKLENEAPEGKGKKRKTTSRPVEEEEEKKKRR
jgi:hypothetical protein